MVFDILQMIFLTLIGSFFLWTIAGHILTWRYYGKYDQRHPLTDYAPAVSIIKPTKGIDHRAFENFCSFCEQEYANEYEILFCVEDPDDPVVPIIRKVMAQYPACNIRLILTGQHETTAIAKLKNMVVGLRHSTHDITIFSDSDVAVPPTFLRDTVACMTDERVGLGFCAQAVRCTQNWPAALEAVSVNELVLNLAPVCLLGMFDGAIASTMVVRKSAIQKIGGLEQFGQQMSDEIPLARKLIEHGYTVHLLKSPAIIIHPYDTISVWWNHMHRWGVIIRFYWPLKSIITNIIFLAPWWGLLYLLIELIQGENMIFGFSLLAAVLCTSILSTTIINRRFAHNTAIWRFLWVVPIYEICRLPLFIQSRLTNKIAWRGRVFRIYADCSTKILEPATDIQKNP